MLLDVASPLSIFALDFGLSNRIHGAKPGENVDDSMHRVERAVDLIAEADSIWIGAGAGMGVDSGLPDFRGDEGFWNAYPPYRHLGLSFIDLANPRWFRQHPAQAWGFYGHRLQMYRATEPHQGYRILLKWARQRDGRAFVFTSNVDGHFQKAGFPETQVVECHGSIHHLQCSQPCCREIWPADSYLPEVDESTMQAAEPLPACPKCGSVGRPNILMFGDWNWVTTRVDEQMANYRQWMHGPGERPVMLEFGAGTAVPTVRYEAERLPGTLIRVNPFEAEVPDGLSFACGALEFLQRVDDRLG